VKAVSLRLFGAPLNLKPNIYVVKDELQPNMFLAAEALMQGVASVTRPGTALYIAAE
jgi:hypothetical protein